MVTLHKTHLDLCMEVDLDAVEDVVLVAEGDKMDFQDAVIMEVDVTETVVVVTFHMEEEDIQITEGTMVIMVAVASRAAAVLAITINVGPCLSWEPATRVEVKDTVRMNVH